ncbi:MAG: hypothetical protein CL847_06875 [Crocinitomicaceae bacterium]|nr:hypothetical protein [Crocinitomicaceae bacterium]|tara:strand:+ start:902 stop:1966 length:1065 start_codon:yes stop_codon:yes gene_type:complete
MRIFITALVYLISMSMFGQLSNESILVDGLNRTYLLYLPSGFNSNESLPLILNFHGGSGTANDQLYTADMRDLAEDQNFILVYPNAHPDPNSNQETNWQVVTSGDLPFTVPNPHSDIIFIDNLIDHLHTQLNVDLNRVYALGYSNGGGFTFDLGCRLNNKITGIGVVARTMYAETYNNCEVTHPTPIVTILGTEDYVSNYDGITYEGTLYYHSNNSTNDLWIESNNLIPTSNLSLIPDINSNDGSTVELFSWSSEDECIDLYHYKVNGGGHDWPGTFGNMDIVSHEIIWSHLSEYGMNGKLDCNSSNINMNTAILSKKLTKIVDALGREIDHTTNQILFHIYDDGSVEKKFIIQ